MGLNPFRANDPYYLNAFQYYATTKNWKWVKDASMETKGLPISTQSGISYKNQSFDLQYKSNGRFLYEMQHWAEMG